METGNGAMNNPHSYLFVPGHRADRFEKAAASGAHRIIIDLEDAVGPGEKDDARRNVVSWFQQGGSGVVRINGADTFWFDADLAAVASCPHAEVMVPKATVASLQRVARFLIDTPLLALVESVEGLVDIHAVAAVDAVTRLAFGNLDFGVDSRISGGGSFLDPARFQIALASRHANLLPPIDGVTVSLDDEVKLLEDVERAKGFGFSAKLCIHPRQIGVVNAGFLPSETDIAWASTILAAVQSTQGEAIQIDGKMVDKPIIERARAILSGRSA